MSRSRASRLIPWRPPQAALTSGPTGRRSDTGRRIIGNGETDIGSPVGVAVRDRIRGCALHAPAHLDADILTALGRLNRSGLPPGARTALLELVAASVGPTSSG
jgi:hypothetical protein